MFTIGVDLGQRRDHSAIAVAERVATGARGFDYVNWTAREPEGEEWVVRHLDRIPLGTPYTTVTERIAALAQRPPVAGKCQFVVDATGVGMPVIDMLRATCCAHSSAGCGLAAVWITGGFGERFDGSVWHVPKLELMARLQSLFERDQLRIARRLRESERLVRELLDMRTVRGRSGRVRVGADGAGKHDDLALAVALAVWPRRKAAMGHQGKRIL
jgi:hypothetical protein